MIFLLHMGFRIGTNSKSKMPKQGFSVPFSQVGNEHFRRFNSNYIQTSNSLLSPFIFTKL